MARNTSPHIQHMAAGVLVRPELGLRRETSLVGRTQGSFWSVRYGEMTKSLPN